MKRILETAVLIMGTLGFWGFVYPELCVTGDAIEADWEDDREAREEDVYDFLNGEGKICIKFGTMEYLYQVKEKTDGKKVDNHD